MATAEFSKFAGILSVALSQHHLLIFEETTDENFPELVNDINLQVKDTVLSRIYNS